MIGVFQAPLQPELGSVFSITTTLKVLKHAF
jgi:hypothetical protein